MCKMNLFNLYFHVKWLKEQSIDYLMGNAPTFHFDDTFIFVSTTTAQVYSDQCKSLMTAANYEFQLRSDVKMQQELGLYESTSSWEHWDDWAEDVVAELTASIIASQKEIIAIIADYPQICGASKCVLPQAYASVSQWVSANQTIHNEQYYTDIANRISDSLGQLMVCYLKNTASKVLDKRRTNVLDTRTNYSPSNRKQRTHSRTSVDLETLINGFASQMLKLQTAFKIGIIKLVAAAANTNTKAKYDGIKLNFESQAQCLFSKRNTQLGNVNLRSLENRSVQVSLLCFMQSFAPDALKSMCERNQKLKDVCDEVEGFVNQICNAMLHFYNTTQVTSTVNVYYKPPPATIDSLGGRGNSILYDTVRMMNNVLVLGPLLQGMHANCNLQIV